jgi:hypothetical protein
MDTAVAERPAQTGNGKAAAPALRPFITGTRPIDRQIYDNTTVMTTGTVRLPTYTLDTDGYTRGMYILCEATAVNTTASTAAFTEDGPFIAFATIQFSDTNNKPIIGPMTGHDLAMVVKYGGYAFSDDAKNSCAYSVTTGTGTSGGSFRFIIRVPIELVRRDGLGALLNKSASAVYKLDLTLNTLASVYSDDPTTSVSIRTRIQQFGWMDSDKVDYMKNATDPNPPALNTMQYWDKQTLVVNAGAINLPLNTFNGLVRNLVWELRDSNQSRTAGDNDFPDPFEVHYDKTVPVSRNKNVWRHMITEDFGYSAATEATATPLSRDNGIYPLPYNVDYGLKPGAESRFGYLPVSAATSVVARGTVGGSGSHTFNVFVNYVWPANGDPKSLTGGR